MPSSLFANRRAVNMPLATVSRVPLVLVGVQKPVQPAFERIGARQVRLPYFYRNPTANGPVVAKRNQASERIVFLSKPQAAGKSSCLVLSVPICVIRGSSSFFIKNRRFNQRITRIRQGNCKTASGQHNPPLPVIHPPVLSYPYTSVSSVVKFLPSPRPRFSIFNLQFTILTFPLSAASTPLHSLISNPQSLFQPPHTNGENQGKHPFVQILSQFLQKSSLFLDTSFVAFDYNVCSVAFTRVPSREDQAVLHFTFKNAYHVAKVGSGVWVSEGSFLGGQGPLPKGPGFRRPLARGCHYYGGHIPLC